MKKLSKLYEEEKEKEKKRNKRKADKKNERRKANPQMKHSEMENDNINDVKNSIYWN